MYNCMTCYIHINAYNFELRTFNLISINVKYAAIALRNLSCSISAYFSSIFYLGRVFFESVKNCHEKCVWPKKQDRFMCYSLSAAIFCHFSYFHVSNVLLRYFSSQMAFEIYTEVFICIHRCTL